MKTTITRFQRRGILLCCMALGSLLLINCSTKDMEYIDPYEFVNDDFEEVEDLQPVEDEDPVIEEPETGSVEESEETNEVLDDVLGSEDGEVSEETKEKMEEVENFTSQLPASVNEAAEAMDESAIDNILDESQELPEDLTAVRESLKTVPEKVKAMLPKINLSVSTGETSARTPYFFNPEVSDFIAQQVSGPCADAAYDAYDAKIASLTEQRDSNLATIEGNYTRRLGEADARYTNRLAAQAEKYAVNKADVKNTLNNLLTASQKALDAENTELAKQLKQLTLLYAVDARAALEEWNILVLQLLEDKLAEEKAQPLQIRDTKTAEVTTAFNTSKSQVETVLNNSLKNCHNQGSGN